MLLIKISELFKDALTLKLCLLILTHSDTHTCPSTGSPLLQTDLDPLSSRIFFLFTTRRETQKESWLTVELGGRALSVRSLGGQEKGLVVQIAVWGGRFVVRPEFSRVHVAAQGEQRLAELPRNHRILEGAASAGRWETAEGGGEKGGGKGRRRQKPPWSDAAWACGPSLATSLAVSPLSPSTTAASASSAAHSSLSLSLLLPPSPAPSFYLRLLGAAPLMLPLPLPLPAGEQLLRMAWLYHLHPAAPQNGRASISEGSLLPDVWPRTWPTLSWRQKK